MNDRQKWRERVRDIRASGTTWWYTYIYICVCVCVCMSSSWCHAASTDFPDTLSQSSLSSITFARSSRLHPVSIHSCCRLVLTGRPTPARTCEQVHSKASLMGSYLHPVCLVHLIWMDLDRDGWWPYSCCFEGAVEFILQYGCTTWTLTWRIEKKLDGNCTRIYIYVYVYVKFIYFCYFMPHFEGNQLINVYCRQYLKNVSRYSSMKNSIFSNLIPP